MLRQELLGIEQGVGTASRGVHDLPASNPDLLQLWVLFSACSVDICVTVADQTSKWAIAHKLLCCFTVGSSTLNNGRYKSWSSRILCQQFLVKYATS